jgi:cell division protein FtsI (penicillin-binding protein 3)
MVLSGGLKKDSTVFYYAAATKDVKQVLNTLAIDYVDSANSQPWSSMYGSNGKPVVNTRWIAKNTMPNIRGMGLKDALYLLESMNMKVLAKGRGRVTVQSIDPGAAINKNQLIKIELN